MSAKGIARVGDQVEGICPNHVDEEDAAISLDFTGTWLTGSTIVTLDGLGVVRIGDTGLASCGHTFTASEGSSINTADGLGIHRLGDAVSILGANVGTTISGSTNGDSL
jgi:uncharacterized Zn-binding protein involved in type VI secretion